MDTHSEALTTKIIPHTIADDFSFKGAAERKRKRSDAEPECCSICLEAITERAVAVPCNHLTFDFICLIQWLQEHSSCPLCKARVEEVQYDWRGPEDYKTYFVAHPHAKEAAEVAIRGGIRSHETRALQRAARRTRDGPPSQSDQEDPGLMRRREVYENRTFSLHVGANRFSKYRNLTPADFAASMELQSQARAFLRRELRVFDFLDRDRVHCPRDHRGTSRDFLVEYIVAILKTNEPKAADGHAESLVAEFLGREDARLLLHEIDAWLKSPYTDLAAWDEHVQYMPPPLRRQDMKEGRSRVAG